MTALETAELHEHLSSNVRYAVYDSARGQLEGTELFLDIHEASLAVGGENLATVIVPSAITQED